MAATAAAALSGLILCFLAFCCCVTLAIPYLLLLSSIVSAGCRAAFVPMAAMVGAKMALRSLSLSSRYAGFYGVSGRIAQYSLHLSLVYLCCHELSVSLAPVR